MKDKKLNTLIKISLLAAIAFILMFFEFPLPIFPSFLKIDLGDLPALLGAFALGPMAGVIVEFLKNILYIALKGTQTAFIGEFANILVGGILVYTAGIVYKRKKSRKNAVAALLVAAIVMTISASILNYFVFLPMYEKILHFPISAVVGMGNKINPKIVDLNTFIIWSIVPYNLLKVSIISVATFALYKGVSPILHKEEINVPSKAPEKETV